MEHALNWAIEQKPEMIRIFGATGGRLDHIFANMQLLINPIKEKREFQSKLLIIKISFLKLLELIQFIK